MLMSPVELTYEKDCAGKVQQKLKTTDPTLCQGGHAPHQQIRNCLIIIQE
jgi:hypothetical protein